MSDMLGSPGTSLRGKDSELIHVMSDLMEKVKNGTITRTQLKRFLRKEHPFYLGKGELRKPFEVYTSGATTGEDILARYKDLGIEPSDFAERLLKDPEFVLDQRSGDKHGVLYKAHGYSLEHLCQSNSLTFYEVLGLVVSLGRLCTPTEALYLRASYAPHISEFPEDAYVAMEPIPGLSGNPCIFKLVSHPKGRQELKVQSLKYKPYFEPSDVILFADNR